jgi:hypothetical protein
MFSSMETSYDYVCYMSTTNFDHLVISVEQVKGDGGSIIFIFHTFENIVQEKLP